MSYEAAMEAAGATVHVSEHFGDYQGTAWAKVTYNGVTGWVCYGFGSWCSGCDAYEDWLYNLPDTDWQDGRWTQPTQEALARFGKDYLDDIMTQERAEEAAARDSGWDCEADTVVQFIRDNANT